MITDSYANVLRHGHRSAAGKGMNRKDTEKSGKPPHSEHETCRKPPHPPLAGCCQGSARACQQRLKCNALPDKLHRVICTVPLASAGCTNCIPCLETRQRRASGLASTREKQPPYRAGMGDVLGEPQVRQAAARLHGGVALPGWKTTLSPFHACLPSPAACIRRHTHTHTRTPTPRSRLRVTLAAGLWSNAHAIYTAAHAY